MLCCSLDTEPLASWWPFATQVRRVISYIDAHLGEELSLRRLSELVHLSPYHFVRAFRQSTGRPPHRYVLEQRIARAQVRLMEPELSLADVGYELGFASQAHFTTTFRKLVGITPGASQAKPKPPSSGFRSFLPPSRSAVVCARGRAMARAYTAELRDRVLLACERGGLSRAAIAELFGVGESTPLPLAAGVADRGPAGGEAARRRARAAPGRGGAGPARGAGGGGRRPDPGRVRGRAPRARRGGGERPDRVPGAQEARPHAQKRRRAPPSGTGPSWPRPGRRGGPSWPGSSRGAWCSWTSAASTPG